MDEERNDKSASNDHVTAAADARETAPGSGPPSTEGWLSRARIEVDPPGPHLEPKPSDREYRSGPYHPDTILDGWLCPSFIVRAASVRGDSHRFSGVPRQDDFALLLRACGDQLLVAVADGVSAAKHSHIGATVAVRYAVQWLDRSLGDPVGDTDWNGLVTSSAWKLVELAAERFPLEEKSEKAAEAEALIATTLTCAVLEADEDGGATVHLIGVGDSGAWILADGAFVRVAGGKEESEDGITSSAVIALPRRASGEVAATKVRLEPGHVLLLGTDGFGDPLGDGTGEVGNLFASLLADRVPPMIEFAHALDFSRRTFDDDRTLVAVWACPLPMETLS